MKITKLTPEDLYVEASKRGFLVQPSIDNSSGRGRIIGLIRIIPPDGGPKAEDVETDALEILEGVPRGWLQRKIETERMPLKNGSEQVGAWVFTVEKGFYDEACNLEKSGNALVRERDVLGKGFDIKVEEEIEADDEVVYLEEQVRVAQEKIKDAQQRHRVLVENLLELKERKRGERAGLRESYLYVANEREL